MLFNVRALQCSLELQAKVGTYHQEVKVGTEVKDIKLSLHIAVGAGKLYVFHVGGEDGRWECFITGHILHRLCQHAETPPTHQGLPTPGRLRFLQGRSISSTQYNTAANASDTGYGADERSGGEPNTVAATLH